MPSVGELTTVTKCIHLLKFQTSVTLTEVECVPRHKSVGWRKNRPRTNAVSSDKHLEARKAWGTECPPAPVSPVTGDGGREHSLLLDHCFRETETDDRELQLHKNASNPDFYLEGKRLLGELGS